MTKTATNNGRRTIEFAASTGERVTVIMPENWAHFRWESTKGSLGLIMLPDVKAEKMASSLHELCEELSQ